MNDPWLWLAGGLVVVVLLSVRCRRGERCFNGSAERDVYRRWGPQCAYRWVVPHRCTGGLQIDHQWPHSRGGRTKSSNGQPLCAAVNQRKGTRHNWPFVLSRSIPVFGWLLYLARWVRAEGVKR
jgi:5-methylcytosine-specific restriction endonuclease McrA